MSDEMQIVNKVIEGLKEHGYQIAPVDHIKDLVAELRKLQDIIDNQADRILDLEAALALSNGDRA